MRQADFFIGSQTPGRYVTFLEEFQESQMRSILLQGPPGCGKSELIRGIPVQGEQMVEYFMCPMDNQAFDGLWIPEHAMGVFDSTIPHQLSNQYPLASQFEFTLYPFLDMAEFFGQTDKICDYIDQKETYATRCQSYLQAMRTLMQESFSLVLEATDTQKIRQQAERISAKELPKTNQKGVEHRRFLSAITPQGISFCARTVDALCDRVYLLYDEYQCSQRLFLNAIRAAALENGYEMYSCYSPLGPFDLMEHIIIPSLRLGFVTLSRYCSHALTSHRTLRYHRFTDLNQLKDKREKLHFYSKTMDEMKKEAVICMQKATECHNALLGIYGSALDLRKLEIGKKDCTNLFFSLKNQWK